MSTEQTAYPPCQFRLDDNAAGTRARCNNPAGIYCGCFVEPARCQLCLSGPQSLKPPKLQATRKRSTRNLVVSRAGVSTNDPMPDPPKPPGLIRRAFSYAEALAHWTAAGRPERSDKEVERIFSKHCKCCKWFDPTRQICRSCGCRVAESGIAVLNKIKMATEHCPRELW